ncbi:Uncharacterized protein HZ326_18061 [Fusarium oxysporum f. sp. albedinis]|nr:Uncharacterized protein HZ326_18061 [Fusarium oxysporum f. sp. albedinis]
MITYTLRHGNPWTELSPGCLNRGWGVYLGKVGTHKHKHTTSQDDVVRQHERQAKEEQAKSRREKRERIKAQAEATREQAALKALQRVEEGDLLNDSRYHV